MRWELLLREHWQLTCLHPYCFGVFIIEPALGALPRYGFRRPPYLELKARPKLGEREVTLVHVTDWIEKKLEQEFQVCFFSFHYDSFGLLEEWGVLFFAYSIFHSRLVSSLHWSCSVERVLRTLLKLASGIVSRPCVELKSFLTLVRIILELDAISLK